MNKKYEIIYYVCCIFLIISLIAVIFYYSTRTYKCLTFDNEIIECNSWLVNRYGGGITIKKDGKIIAIKEILEIY